MRGAFGGGEDRKAAIRSNGGGASCLAGPDRSVHRTRTASPDEPGLDKVADDLRQLLGLADDLRQLLELPEGCLTRILGDGEPGSLYVNLRGPFPRPLSAGRE